MFLRPNWSRCSIHASGAARRLQGALLGKPTVAPSRRKGARRWRRLMVEQFEPRMLLSAAPNGTDGTVTLAEDAAYVLQVPDFGFSDPNDSPPDTFVALKITTLPVNGALMLNGSLAVAGTIVSVASINAGLLRFVPFPSASSLSYASITCQVQDSGNVANGGVNLGPTPNTITINVLPVNDPPTGKDASISYEYWGGPGNVLGVNLSAAALAFTDLADFPENALRGIKITTLPTGGVLTRNGNLVNAGDIVPLVGPSAELLHYQPTVVGSPFLIQDSFKFQVEDDGGTANGGIDVDQAPKTMALYGYLAVLNGAPVSQPDKTLTLFEDRDYTFSAADFDFTGPQDGSSVQSVTMSTVPSVGMLLYTGNPVPPGMLIPAIGISQGLLQFRPQANGNGGLYSSFSATVQDSAGGRDSPYTIGFSVVNVNDPPFGVS